MYSEFEEWLLKKKEPNGSAWVHLTPEEAKNLMAVKEIARQAHEAAWNDQQKRIDRLEQLVSDLMKGV